MPRLKNVFIVQPYWQSPRGLAAGQASRHPSEEGAKRYARTLVPVYQGVQVMRIEVEEQFDFCSEPTLLEVIGEVPQDCLPW